MADPNIVIVEGVAYGSARSDYVARVLPWLTPAWCPQSSSTCSNGINKLKPLRDIGK